MGAGYLKKALELLEKEKQEKAQNKPQDETVNPFDIEFADNSSDEDVSPLEEESEYDTPEREEFRNGIINKYLKQPPEGWDNMTTSEKEDFIHGLLNDVGEKFFPMPEDVSDEEDEELNVPELETEVSDLPPEEENEKEIKVEHNDPTIVTDAEDNVEVPEDVTVFDPEETEDDALTDKEVADIEKSLAEQGAEKSEPEKKEEPKAEPKKEQKKSEPEKKTNLKRTENKKQKSKSQYEHIPTPLRVAEDVGKATQTVAEDVGNVANTIGKQGTSGTSINADVRSAVPHYDYRSLFR